MLSPEQGYTDKYLRRTIHHELSSVLIRDRKFPVKKWRAALPAGVVYDDTIDKEVKAIKPGRDLVLANNNLLNRGFLSSYGRTNCINDVNTYAELLFVEPDKLKNYRKNTAHKTKYTLLVIFYEILDLGYKW